LSFGSIFAGWYMRHTGKFWWLNVWGAALSIVACALFITWSDVTPSWRLWLDIVPNGFGMCSLITSTLIALIAACDKADIAVATGVSYLFRTTGQVLGVSLSGALVQGLLTRFLRERIKGPDAAQLIEAIRHSTGIIPSLDEQTKAAAVESYALALRAVFICQLVLSVITVLCTLPIEENPLPYVTFLRFQLFDPLTRRSGSHEEAEQQERERRERRERVGAGRA